MLRAMARKLRIEYKGAMYHIISRGNYRSDVFEAVGAKKAFEECLFEACEKTGWRLHAYVVMSNHYHLALETPHAMSRYVAECKRGRRSRAQKPLHQLQNVKGSV